jgi:hypothetical protein
MTATLVSLLLTSAPAPPTPNKWTKLWKPLDFVAIGVSGFDLEGVLFTSWFPSQIKTVIIL